MRACTAAGINISLLPRDAAAVDLPVVLYGKRPLFPGIFGIRHIRYRRGPPVVRNMRAVLKKATLGHRMGFLRHSVRKNPLLWYGADIRVLKTGFCGTRRIFVLYHKNKT